MSFAQARSADGTPIAFAAAAATATGDPVVLVHGAGGNAASWLLVARQLAASFTVLSVERRGRGASGATARTIPSSAKSRTCSR
ncbi:alpha/beta fold hydrolase [Fodinicola feengrottensis]|uniref:alpha/beta fold hydrolase n=1 Tax=Fodinicola feengrottensis TaxID=435914 RepID=UPI0028BED156|nr:alpha/beta fold hydrolase [Fodinicola feengrottensis]